MIHDLRSLQLTCRRHMNFNQDWLFFEGNEAGASKPAHIDNEWRRLDVPHDWSIEKPFDPDMPHGGSQGYLPRWTIGWYRKHFTLDQKDRKKNIFIQFDGVHHNSEVWINGHYLGKRPYGYISFQYDLTPYLNWEADNVIAVKVDNTVMPSDRWYSGAGIYRKVELIVCNQLYVEEWGSYITTTQITSDSAMLDIKLKLVNRYDVQKTAVIRHVIMGPDLIPLSTESSTSVVLLPGESKEIAQQMKLADPMLWSPEQPSMYTAYSTIIVDDILVDDYITPFGIRDIRYDPQDGFFLNGVSTKMKGVNLHHDLGCLGAAYDNRAMERRLEILKSMGCNAIRWAHNPMSPEVLDLCDRMGFLVIAEAFDKWKSLYYEQLFDEWWEKDLHAMLIRDRNHPSIVMWSIGNEVEQQGQDSMLEMLESLVQYTHRVDPTRPVTCALEPHNWPMTLRNGTIEEKVEHTKRLAERVDILGLNYQEQWYIEYKEAMPDVIVVGTETFPYYRGNGNRVKGYEPINPWFDVIEHDYVIGQFVWAGIDYLGETSYPSKGWSSGLMDTCGFRKPISYLQESLWSDSYMVQIAVFDETMEAKHTPQWTMHWKAPEMASHWNFPHLNSKIMRIVTFTNCETVELIVNGESYGQKRLTDYPDHMIIWHLPYSAGQIEAIGRVEEEIVTSHVLQTAAQPYRLQLHTDRTELAADGSSIAHVTVKVVDEQGIQIPDGELLVKFELIGEGILAGVDNGNLISDESYKGNQRSTYQGQCLAVIRSTRQAGSIQFTASAEGVISDTIKIHTKLSS